MRKKMSEARLEQAIKTLRAVAKDRYDLGHAMAGHRELLAEADQLTRAVALLELDLSNLRNWQVQALNGRGAK